MAEVKNIILPVTGMTCTNCATTIESNVRKLPGVNLANVNLANEKLTVAFDPTQLNEHGIIARVECIGYGIAVSPQSGTISIYDLPPGAQYIVESWDIYTTQQIVSQVIRTAQANGSLLVNVASIRTDLAYKLRQVLVPRKFMPSIVE
jgi:copper chaperone CopZ